MIKSTHNSGFQMTFQNGITISVQFGARNYCERKGAEISYRGDMDAAAPIITSKNAEIAIWDGSDHWFDFGVDQVKGWCDADEVAQWIHKVATAGTLEDIKI